MKYIISVCVHAEDEHGNTDEIDYKILDEREDYFNAVMLMNAVHQNTSNILEREKNKLTSKILD